MKYFIVMLLDSSHQVRFLTAVPANKWSFLLRFLIAVTANPRSFRALIEAGLGGNQGDIASLITPSPLSYRCACEAVVDSTVYGLNRS